MPSSLDTKAADDADVPDFGVCLVQFTQLLGGGTGVRASGILSGRAIRHGQETTLLFDYHPLSPQGHVAGGPSAARRPSSGEKWPRGVRACTCGMIVAHSRLILTYASLSALEPNPLCAQAAGVSGKGKKADKITGRLEKCARNTQELSQSKKRLLAIYGISRSHPLYLLLAFSNPSTPESSDHLPRCGASLPAWSNAGEIGGFGSGSLEQPRQWPGAQWAGRFPWECRASQSRQACPEEARGPSGGTAKGPL